MKMMPATHAMTVTVETTAATMANSRYDVVFGDVDTTLGGIDMTAMLGLVIVPSTRLFILALVTMEELPGGKLWVTDDTLWVDKEEF